MESLSSLFGASLEPVYYCNSVSVREKPSRYGQDSIHSPQFVVFRVFDQFSDLDLRHNIFNPIIFISNKKLSCAVGQFRFITEIVFPLYSERKHFVSKPSRSYWVVPNKRIFNYLCFTYQKKEKIVTIILFTVGIGRFFFQMQSPTYAWGMGCNLDW